MGGLRKRSRTPSSSGSESRLAPRDPFRRSHGDHGSSRFESSTPPSNLRSAIGSHDEFLDDVRFDVAPKDMCIAASQGSTRGDDESVVLQQLCSLGSVLAGGKGDAFATAGAAAAADEGGRGLEPYWGEGNNSRGADSNGGGGGGGGDNLLSRWLQPPTAPGGQGVSAGSKEAREGGVGDNLADVSDTPKIAGGGGGGSGGGGGGSGKRVVGDWAAKALLRKKLADAERGRRLRLQHEQDVGVSVSILTGGGDSEKYVGALAVVKEVREVKEVTPASSTSSPSDLDAASPLASNQHSAAPVGMVVAEADDSRKRRPLGEEALSNGAQAKGGATASTPVRSPLAVGAPNALGESSRRSVTVASTSDLACNGGNARSACDSGGSGDGSGDSGGSGGANGGGVGSVGSVAEEDEYGDDFDFLTDADFQALEEGAAKTVAASSQQASQHGSRHVDLTQSDPTPSQASYERAGTTSANNKRGPSPSNAVGSSSSRKGGGSGMYSTPKASPAAAVISADFRSAGSKTAGGIGTRPPLSALGPNPKRRDLDQCRPVASAVAARSAGSAGFQGTPGDSCDASPRWHSQGRIGQQRRGTPGSAQGAGDAWRTPVNAAASRKSGPKTDIEGGDAPSRKDFSGQEDVGTTSQSRAAASRSDVFTTYDSMEDFTRSTAAVAATAALPRRGNQRTTDVVSVSGQATPGDPSISTGAAPFVPALVHRRFLVLEVTYVSASRGNGSREKMLMALEQSPKGGMAAEAYLDGVVPAEGGSGAGVAQQRKITLLGDWYDCEVEPGDVVHVLFPVAPGVDEASSSPPGKVGGERGGENASSLPSPSSSLDVVVDNASGRLLVVQPDILVSPTKVAETVLCARRAVLQSRLSSDASKSKPAVLGHLKHELFETSLLAAAAAATAASVNVAPFPRGGHRVGSDADRREQQQSPAGAAASAWQMRGGAVGRRDLLTSQYMAKLVDHIVVSQLEALYGAGLDEDAARRELLSVSGPILNWHRSFIARGGNLHGGHGARGGGGGGEGGFASLGPDGVPAARVTVSRVLATEDDVWSPVLGLKGIMDATVEAVVQPLVRPAHRGQPPAVTAAMAATGLPAGTALGGGETRSLVMPVELKTGKRIGDAHSNHRAQVCKHRVGRIGGGVRGTSLCAVVFVGFWSRERVRCRFLWLSRSGDRRLDSGRLYRMHD